MINVTVQACKENTVELLFQVTDTGIGIMPEVGEQLFKPFVQADSSTVRRFGGTGLELSISKTLIDLMGGTIGFDSVLNRGSIFWFCPPF
ncbi:MAG: multi-sensor hybrid histidine kinase [Rhodospirillaceae bacterium]|nr:MAG: multi-sensor hybrid histidine kinase [Rhodospirillaceae bacterium]